MIAALIAIGIVCFSLAYRFYGRFLTKLFGLSDDRATPAHELSDGRDYCPAKPAVLFGHHFSSIAGAGPIVGPIFAALVFGWVPAVLWIIVGAIFVGGVHDFGALVVSVRNRAQSIAHAAGVQLSPLSGKLFLVFVWLALVYVIVVFLDLTAATFAPTVPAGISPERASAIIDRGGSVATASIAVICLAIALGLLINKRGVSLVKASLVFVPLMFLAVVFGPNLPLSANLMPAIGGSPATTWRLLVLGYCLIASVTPVWLLLQPRDYLSSYLLYACLFGGIVGIGLSAVSGDASVALNYPAFIGFHSAKLGYLFPALFITVACGACSGFHSIVASGTTAKQLARENDARTVGYGSMLVEGLLALIAVATVAVLAQGSAETKLPPPALFAAGLSRFLALVGIPPSLGQTFGMLALSTFLLTTLDTCTRLGRYVLAELLGLKGAAATWFATAATLALPVMFSVTTFHDANGQVVPAWRLIWPVFGATNQLLGGLALMVLTVWLKAKNKPIWATVIPMAFMLSVTLLALVQLIIQYGTSLIGLIATALLILAVVLLIEAIRTMIGKRRDPQRMAAQ